MKNLKSNIDNHIKKEIYPFHMPGHKQNYNFFDDETLNKILKYDLTEIPTLDNLNYPEEVLLNLNDRISKVFGSYKSFLVVNGSTVGVIASILSTCNSDDFILASRNSHKSLFSAITLAKCNVEYIYPEVLHNNIIGGVNPLDIENLILNNPKIKAVFITSPTYEGIVSDIKSISSITKKYNKILIVDEAHGSHFNLDNYFPTSAISLGADIVIQSLHKTLPSLTQTAVIHINEKAMKYNVSQYISMLQTSSPSYIFMYTVDKLIQDIENKKLNYTLFIKNLEFFRKNFNEQIGVNKKIQLLETKSFDFDKSRLTFLLNCNKSGSEIDEILREKYKIQLEMSSNNHFIAISTICDTSLGFNLLFSALKEIDKSLSYKKTSYNNICYYNNIQKIKLGNISYTNTQDTNINNCENLICADFIVPYPPGIPFLMPGEVITNIHIQTIKDLSSKNINIIGFTNNKIKTHRK